MPKQASKPSIECRSDEATKQPASVGKYLGEIEDRVEGPGVVTGESVLFKLGLLEDDNEDGWVEGTTLRSDGSLLEGEARTVESEVTPLDPNC